MRTGFWGLRCGLIGEHLQHSFSPEIHALLADYPYRLFELAPDEVGSFLRKGEFDAINVTIPYKKTVIPYLDFVSPEAQRIGAVNTIVRNKEGKLLGYNTDYFGFAHTVRSFGISVDGKKVLVLGSGGACATVCAVLSDMGAQVVVISRTGENHYGNLDRHADAAMIVNTTPVGMYPHNGTAPLSLSQFPALCGVIDLIYNPTRTRLLLDAEQLGIPTVNGLSMLSAQAAQAAEYFTGIPATAEEIITVTETVAARMRNIILIGMPGCGKSTIGKRLALHLHREFYDADEVFDQTHPRSPAEILRTDGEDAFRAMEHDMICDLCKKSGCVIATGGGIVVRPDNYAPLHQNGVIVWIDRDPNKLPTDGRPLSQSVGVHVLYERRKDAYCRFADITVKSNEVLEDTLAAILEALQNFNT